MYVLAEDHLSLGDPAQGLYNPFVAFLLCDLLIPVAGEGVGACAAESGTTGRSPRPNPTSQLSEASLSFSDRRARRGLYLENRLKELIREGLLKILRQTRHNLLYLGYEFARARIYYMKLFFDTQSVGLATVELNRHDSLPRFVSAGLLVRPYSSLSVAAGP